MIYVGSQVQHFASCLCPTCGKTCLNRAAGETLVTVCCENKDCADSYTAFMFDRSTGVIMWTEAHIVAWVKGLLQKEGKS